MSRIETKTGMDVRKKRTKGGIKNKRWKWMSKIEAVTLESRRKKFPTFSTKYLVMG